MLIVSLSTIPTRFGLLEPTLTSLLAQSAHIDEIRVNIPKRYRRFPDYDGTYLPEVPKGIRVVQTEEDWGPATKVLAATADLKAEDCDIAFCDDDRIMPAHWATTLLEGRRDRPDDAISFIGDDLDEVAGQPVQPSRFPRALRKKKDWAYRKARIKQQLAARQIRSVRGKPPLAWYGQAGYKDTLYGTFGALVKPQFFDDASYNIPDVLWSVDDVWLSGCLERQNIGIWVMPGQVTVPLHDAHEVDALEAQILDGADRMAANQACVRYMQETYGIWPAV